MDRGGLGLMDFFLNIRKGGKNVVFFFFWLVDIPFFGGEQTFWKYLFGVFFVESWVLGSVEVCLFFEGVV